jgi:hypothetical protein
MRPRTQPIAFLIGVFALLVGVAVALQQPNQLTEQEIKDGWKLLFDGESLKGWTVAGIDGSWVVDDGALHCTGKGGGGMLYADGVHKNFELKLEFKVSPKGNSGVFLRTWDKNDPVNTGIEVQVLDSYGKEKPSKHDCGAIYDIQAPSKNAAKPAGEWNSYHIICKDNLIVVYLNGEKVNEVDLSRWTEAGRNPDGSPNKFKYAYNTMTRPGYIGLQNHGNPIWYRSIKLKPLD